MHLTMATAVSRHGVYMLFNLVPHCACAHSPSLSLLLHDSHATKENFALSPTNPSSLTPSPLAIKLGLLWALILLLACLSIYSSFMTHSCQVLRGACTPVLRQLPSSSPYSRQVPLSLTLTCPAPAALLLTLFQTGLSLSVTPVSSQLPRSSPHSEQVPDSQASHSSQHPYKPSNSSCVCVCGWGKQVFKFRFLLRPASFLSQNKINTHAYHPTVHYSTCVSFLSLRRSEHTS